MSPCTLFSAAGGRAEQRESALRVPADAREQLRLQPPGTLFRAVMRLISVLRSAYTGLGYMVFSVIWVTFKWSQIGTYIIEFVGYMVFPAFSAFMVYFAKTKGQFIRNAVYFVLIFVQSPKKRFFLGFVARPIAQRQVAQPRKIIFFHGAVVLSIYRAQQNNGYQVARIFQARPGRSGKRQQEQDSRNLGTVFCRTLYMSFEDGFLSECEISQQHH